MALAEPAAGRLADQGKRLRRQRGRGREALAAQVIADGARAQSQSLIRQLPQRRVVAGDASTRSTEPRE